jgi:cyclase
MLVYASDGYPAWLFYMPWNERAQQLSNRSDEGSRLERGMLDQQIGPIRKGATTMAHGVGEMRRPLVYVITSTLLLVGTWSRALAQADKSETVIQKADEQFESTPLVTTSLSNRIFLFSGDGGDVVAIVGDGSTLLIDSGVATRTEELSDAMYKATARPVTQLVNTHWHFDHTGGNLYFGSTGVTIIAQENVKKRLSSVQDVPFVGMHDGHYPALALPTQTYSDSLVLHQGSEELRLIHYGSAHTDGDTVTYITPGNIVVVGDIFSNPFYPIIDLSSGGSIDGLIDAVDEVLAHTDGQTKIVPGHGPIAARAELQFYRDMLVQVRQRVKELVVSGKTIDQVVSTQPTAEFDARWGTGYVSGNVFTQMVYASLVKATTAHSPNLTSR